MITIKNLTKIFENGEYKLKAIDGINLEIKEGEFMAIMGPSGAGKSTFLYQIGLLDHPTSGNIIIDGQETKYLSGENRTKFRLEKMGFVFQDYALIPELTALENIAIPCLMQGCDKKHAYQKGLEALSKVGLKDRANHLPSQMSGGEQQRVSIARAIAHQPKILFADEPTASLDSQRSLEIIKIFTELNKNGQTIIMVTHELEFAQYAKRIIEIKDGKIVNDKKQ